MTNKISQTKLQIQKYLTEEKTEILKLLDTHDRILLQANPASGKTYFFKEIAKDITNGKRKGRLVFVAPFLVIMDQFKNDLNLMGVKVDLELKGSTQRKNIEHSDKIITSTFHSIHHIIDELTEDNILIVDETHALFYNYLNTKGTRDFYIGTIQNLYHTKSKLVVMSGTPNLSLIPILKLHHVVVTKIKEPEAKINIEYSNLNKLEVVKEFALKTIKDNGSDKLNIIYLKNVNGCIKIGEMLTDIGYKAEVITSLHKETDTYNSIVEKQTIPKDVQFLITTNVISTGTNINNSNIGSALMLNEYSPLEIKQFSKRFRKKLDITVEVVNDGYITGLATYNDIVIEEQRNFFSHTLKSHEFLKKIPDSNYNFENSYDKSDLATPDYFINQTLERYLIQECSYIDDAIKTYINPDDIADKLNNYDDIVASVMFDYEGIKKLNYKLGIDSSNSLTDAKFESKINNLIDDFENNTDAYLSAMMSDKLMDSTIRNKTKRLVSNEVSNQVNYSNDILNNIKSPLFNKNILIPFFEFREYFKSTKDFIKFLKSKKNKNSIIASLIINELFTKNFNVQGKSTEFQPTLSKYFYELKEKSSLRFLSKDVPILLRMIKLTFNYCFDKEYVIVSELKKVLENDSVLKKEILNSNDLSLFPLNTISTSKNSFKINNYVVKAIIQGLFYTNQTLTNKTVKGKQRKSIVFKNKLPNGYRYNGLTISKKIFKRNTTLKDFLNTTGKEPMVTVTSNNTNYVNSYELIIKEQL